MTRVWFPPKTWATNDSPAAHEFNTYVRDNQLALVSSCRAVYNGFAGSFAASASSPLVFAGVSRDPTSMWNAGAPTLITAPLPGTFSCKARIGGSVTLSASGQAPYLAIRKNGDTIIAESLPGTGNLLTGDVEVALAASDYVEAVLVTGIDGYNESASLGVGALIADLVVAWVAP